MKRILYLLVFTILIHQTDSEAQSFRDSLEVTHYDIHLKIVDPGKAFISGFTILDIHSVYSTPLLKLDLLSLTVDSILLSGKPVSYSYNGHVISIQHQSTAGVNQNIKVYYHGTPAKDKRWGGFYFVGDEAFNYGVGMDAQPPNFGRVWFPCIDNFTNRATYSFSITIPDGYTAVCNGINTGIEKQINQTTTWNWRLEETIPTYLASVAIGPYDSINYIYDSGNKKIPVAIFDRKENIINTRNSFRNLPLWMRVFEDHFGPYPWSRIGFVIVPFRGGAMEHATNIAISRNTVKGDLNRETLYAHELSHSWFGDLVTCSNEADMWLNEGWASYCESIMLEGVYGHDRFIASILDNQLNVLLHTKIDDGGYYPIWNLPHHLTYGSTIYDKGALVVHNLRAFLGDSLFFDTVKKYLHTYSFNHCSVKDFQHFFETNTKMNLADFFNFWVYNPGFNDICVDSWQTYKVGNQYQTTIQINQRLLGTSFLQKNFSTTLEIIGEKLNFNKFNIKMSGADTTIRLVTDFKPVAVVVDPEYKLLNACVHQTFKLEKKNDTLLTKCLLSCVYKNLEGPALLQVELHFTTPPDSEIVGKGKLNTSKYWKINTVNDFPPQNHILFGLDDTSNQEDNALFYKDNIKSPWKKIQAVKSVGPRQMQYFSISDLAPGYYATGRIP